MARKQPQYTDQMGRVLNDYFGRHPEVYARMPAADSTPATA